MKAWIPKLAGQRILVVGDLILDEYLIGKAARMSREAPVPVLEFESRQLIPGGAANPAANIAKLGNEVIQVGVVGSDTAATNLRQVLQARGIETNSLVIDSGRPTTVKTRILAQMGLRFPQQVARLDTLSREPISLNIQRQLDAMIEREIDHVNAVLISDYGTGLLTRGLVQAIHERGTAANVLLTADAQGNLEKYARFGLMKCNADEARDHLRRDLQSDDDFAEAALEICKTLQLTGGMIITRGAEGATVATCAGQVAHCPSPSVTDVYDTVGAGDTAIAVMTLAVSAGASYAEAATLANTASGLVVRRVGNYAPTPEELTRALDTWKPDL